MRLEKCLGDGARNFQRLPRRLKMLDCFIVLYFGLGWVDTQLAWASPLSALAIGIMVPMQGGLH